MSITKFSYTDRPVVVQDHIDSSFDELSKLYTINEINWSHAGSSKYGICGISEHQLIKRVIQEVPEDQKDVYVIDIGAGAFQWVEALKKSIEEDRNFPLDKKVHIIGVRGEPYLGKRIIETDRTKLYRLGSFKIEEIFIEFQKMGFSFEKVFDVAISSWTLRHLVDGIGTFEQIVNRLLRPGAGIFLFDGFFIANPTERPCAILKSRIRLIQLLIDTKLPFLWHPKTANGTEYEFILKKTSHEDSILPIQYGGECQEINGRRYQCQSSTLAEIVRVSQEDEEEWYPVREFSLNVDFFGNREMYEFLRQNSLIQPDKNWQSFYEAGLTDDRRVPLDHQAATQIL